MDGWSDFDSARDGAWREAGRRHYRLIVGAGLLRRAWKPLLLLTLAAGAVAAVGTFSDLPAAEAGAWLHAPGWVPVTLGAAVAYGALGLLPVPRLRRVLLFAGAICAVLFLCQGGC